MEFPLVKAAGKSCRRWPDQNVSLVIWTTTPWTLPANLAIAVHPDLEYAGDRGGRTKSWWWPRTWPKAC